MTNTIAAMCLWEDVLSRIAEGDALIDEALELHGFREIRYAISTFAAPCEAACDVARENGYDDDFDWAWCPAWLLANVDWSTGFPTLRTET